VIVNEYAFLMNQTLKSFQYGKEVVVAPFQAHSTIKGNEIKQEWSL
jgi:hypothetical protein